jgi:hypothetical protein
MPKSSGKKPKKFRNTQKAILEYSDDLKDVHVELAKEGKPATTKNLMSGLEAKGLKFTYDQFYTVRKKLNERSTFVTAIAQSQYSGMVQDIYEKLNYIEDQCLELASEDWTETKTRSGDGSEGSSFVETTPNQYKPKHDFLKLAKEVQKEKRELLKGDVINVSVAMLEKKFQEVRDESKAKSEQIQHLQKKLKELQK